MATTNSVMIFLQIVAKGNGVQLFYNSHSLKNKYFMHTNCFITTLTIFAKWCNWVRFVISNTNIWFNLWLFSRILNDLTEKLVKPLARLGCYEHLLLARASCVESIKACLWITGCYVKVTMNSSPFFSRNAERISNNKWHHIRKVNGPIACEPHMSGIKLVRSE